MLAIRYTLNKPENELFDGALWFWFMQESRRGTLIRGPKENVVILQSKFQNEGNFVTRHG